MTLAADTQDQSGPEFGETPALSLSAASKPLASLHYTLAAADLAAWLAGTRAERRSLRALVASTLLASLMGLQMLSGKLPLPDAAWARLLELAAGLGLPMTLALWTRRRSLLLRALDDMPAPVTVTLTLWPGRLLLARGAEVQTLRPRLLDRLDVTRGHILGATETARLIIPRRAFADSADMARFAGLLRQQARR